MKMTLKGIDILLRSLAIVILAWLTINNLQLENQIRLTTHRLKAHLTRLTRENEFDEKLCTNGIQVVGTYRYHATEYLDTIKLLKSIYNQNQNPTRSLIEQIQIEHERSFKLYPTYRYLFTHTDLYLDPEVIVRSLLDNKIYLGIMKQLRWEIGKNEIYFNNLRYPFDDGDTFEVSCSDTLKILATLIGLNFQTAELDTTWLQEKFVPADLIK